jgi:nucleoside-diphosphate-sugar epimerase
LLQDAACADFVALEGKAGIYNMADDEAAPTRDWDSMLAEFVGTKSPFPVPAWIARMLIGDHLIAMMRDNCGISNEKAKREPGWLPRWPNWREGFASEFAGLAV